MSIGFPKGWSDFKFRIFINKSVNQVFEAWTKSGILEQWFFESAKYYNQIGEEINPSESVSNGCLYEFKWYGWDHIQKGKIISVEADNHFRFEFFPAGIVNIDFVRVTKDKTEVILAQSEIPHDSEENIKNYFYGCSLGWSFWLVNLKSWLEHGIVLNEFEHPYGGDNRIYELVNH